ncbi:MAG: hypothetical protein H7335_22675 [Massilia sp.]|nr:hypothetical protein [Massilia sp.]
MDMDEPVALNVPPALRRIFAHWGEGCYPAPAPGPEGPVALAAFYRRLAEMHLARHAVARIYTDAALYRDYGQFAEARHEGAQVFPWIAQLVAEDPVLSRRLG